MLPPSEMQSRRRVLSQREQCTVGGRRRSLSSSYYYHLSSALIVVLLSSQAYAFVTMPHSRRINSHRVFGDKTAASSTDYFLEKKNDTQTDAYRSSSSPPLLLDNREQSKSLTAPSGSSEVLSMKDKLKDSIFLGIEPSPDILAIMTIYFVEGALGLARLAQTYLLKEELQLGPAELSALTGIFTLPWTIKPLYGFLSDGVPIFGSRRRSYLILAGLVGCASYTILGQDFLGMFDSDKSSLITATVGSLLVSSACIAMSDVVADGIVVQKTRDSNDPAIAGGLQSLCWGSAAVGGLLSAYFSGSLLEILKPQQVFQLTAVLPFLVACIALLIQEEPLPETSAMAPAESANKDDQDDNKPNMIQSQVSELWNAIREPQIWKPALFLFLWQSTPTSDGAMFFFMTDELHFGPEFMGRVRLLTSVAGLFGVWLYNAYLKTVKIKDILFWSSIAAFPLGMSNLLLITHANRSLGIPDGAFVFGDDVVLSILGQVSFAFAYKLCTK